MAPKIRGNWKGRGRQIWSTWATLVKVSVFTIVPVLLSLLLMPLFFSFYYFTVECGFPPKIKTTIFGVVLVRRPTKALGGITVIMHPISTDRILVDHMKLSLMGSTGTPLEVNSIP